MTLLYRQNAGNAFAALFQARGAYRITLSSKSPDLQRPYELVQTNQLNTQVFLRSREGL